jgi:hypothetical protein
LCRIHSVQITLLLFSANLCAGSKAQHFTTPDILSQSPSAVSVGPNSSSTSSPSKSLSLAVESSSGTCGRESPSASAGPDESSKNAVSTADEDGKPKRRGRPSYFDGKWAAMMGPILDAEFDPTQRLANGFLYHRCAMQGIEAFGYPDKYFSRPSLYIGREKELKTLSKSKQQKTHLKRRTASVKLVTVSFHAFRSWIS